MPSDVTSDYGTAELSHLFSFFPSTRRRVKRCHLRLWHGETKSSFHSFPPSGGVSSDVTSDYGTAELNHPVPNGRQNGRASVSAAIVVGGGSGSGRGGGGGGGGGGEGGRGRRGGERG